MMQLPFPETARDTGSFEYHEVSDLFEPLPLYPQILRPPDLLLPPRLQYASYGVRSYSRNFQQCLFVCGVDLYRVEFRMGLSPKLLRVLVQFQISVAVEGYLPAVESVLSEQKINLVQAVLTHEMAFRAAEKACVPDMAQN